MGIRMIEASPTPDDDMNITVKDLAADLGVRINDIARHVSALCREWGHPQVVHTASSSNGPTLLHGSAADEIRARVRGSAGSPQPTPSS